MLRFRWLYPSAQASVSAARRAVVAFAQSVGFAGEQLQDLELAVGEALANAVEHGHIEDGRIAVDAGFDSGAITIDVSDTGKGFAGWQNSQPAPRKAESVRGFGMRIMHATTDRVQYLEGGRRVRLMKVLAIARNEALEQEQS